jgi:hypothetical protein
MITVAAWDGSARLAECPIWFEEPAPRYWSSSVGRGRSVDLDRNRHQSHWRSCHQLVATEYRNVAPPREHLEQVFELCQRLLQRAWALGLSPVASARSSSWTMFPVAGRTPPPACALGRSLAAYPRLNAVVYFDAQNPPINRLPVEPDWRLPASPLGDLLSIPQAGRPIANLGSEARAGGQALRGS